MCAFTVHLNATHASDIQEKKVDFGGFSLSFAGFHVALCLYIVFYMDLYLNKKNPSTGHPSPLFGSILSWIVCVTRPAGGGGGFGRSESTKEVGEAPKFQGKKQSRRVLPVGQISSRHLGLQNLAEEGEYFREIQVGEMLSFWPDIFLGSTFTKEGGFGSLQPMFFL